jgi:Amt family ammonium transporter
VHVDSGDTAWLLVAAALVMFMTPGLAFFYGGLVRSKNVVGTIMQSFIALGLVSILWATIGYTLAFGPDKAGLIGGLDFFGLHGVGAAPSAYAPTVPATTFMVYQMMFAIITPALIAGAFAERMKFSAYVMFIGLWSILVYAPVAHWEWGGGFLGPSGLGALDFAGGAVVHANAGAAALATAIYLGRRRGHGSDDMSPHNVPFVILGAGILWFGWFGFNAGSALTSGALASSAFVNTQLGAAAAIFGWIIPERMLTGRVSTVGAATGAVAGLATITPAAGFVEPLGAVVIGLTAGVLCFLAVSLKDRLGYDDSLDVVGVHMVGGSLGVVLTGVFASLVINSAGAAASLTQVGKQAVLAGVTVVFSFAATMLILKVTDLTVGLRVSEEHEDVGLDASQHGEVGYRI